MKKEPPSKIGDILQRLLSERGYLNSCFEVDVISKWPLIVGDAIAKKTECTETRDGVLYVRVSSAVWRQEISFLKQEILQKIKDKTRCSTIKDIVFY